MCKTFNAAENSMSRNNLKLFLSYIYGNSCIINHISICSFSSLYEEKTLSFYLSIYLFQIGCHLFAFLTTAFSHNLPVFCASPRPCVSHLAFIPALWMRRNHCRAQHIIRTLANAQCHQWRKFHRIDLITWVTASLDNLWNVHGRVDSVASYIYILNTD